MNNTETKKIIAVIMAAYSNFKPMDLDLLVEIWNDVFAEYDYQIIGKALKAFIAEDTSGFAPTPGQIKAKADLIAPKTDNILNEQEAWLLVSKALRNSSYHAEEEFAKLPEMVKEAVGGAGNLRNWAQTDIESIENVIASNFQRTYRTIMKREKEVASLPTDARQMRDLLTKNDTYTTNLISDISDSEKGTD